VDANDSDDGVGNMSVRVRVTLRLTVSQSVCLGVEPRPGLMTRYWLLSDRYCLILGRAPSLTRGRVCHLSESVSSIMSIVIMYSYIHFMFYVILQYLHGLCQSGLSTADYALFLVAFATTAV
jgi:hypothetical protein